MSQFVSRLNAFEFSNGHSVEEKRLSGISKIAQNHFSVLIQGLLTYNNNNNKNVQ